MHRLRRRLSSLVLIAALSIAIPPPPTRAGEPSCLDAIREHVRRGDRITLLLGEGGTVEGRFEGFDSERAEIRLKLYAAAESRFTTGEFPLAEIRGFEKRQGPAAPGAILGVVGATTGFLFGSLLAALDDSADSNGEGTTLLVWTGTGLLVGFGLGTVLSGLLGKRHAYGCSGS